MTQVTLMRGEDRIRLLLLRVNRASILRFFAGKPTQNARVVRCPLTSRLASAPSASSAVDSRPQIKKTAEDAEDAEEQRDCGRVTPFSLSRLIMELNADRLNLLLLERRGRLPLCTRRSSLRANNCL